jgi:hypothetical protein
LAGGFGVSISLIWYIKGAHSHGHSGNYTRYEKTQNELLSLPKEKLEEVQAGIVTDSERLLSELAEENWHGRGYKTNMRKGVLYLDPQLLLTRKITRGRQNIVFSLLLHRVKKIFIVETIAQLADPGRRCL